MNEPLMTEIMRGVPIFGFNTNPRMPLMATLPPCKCEPFCACLCMPFSTMEVTLPTSGWADPNCYISGETVIVEPHYVSVGNWTCRGSTLIPIDWRYVGVAYTTFRPNVVEPPCVMELSVISSELGGSLWRMETAPASTFIYDTTYLFDYVREAVEGPCSQSGENPLEVVFRDGDSPGF